MRSLILLLLEREKETSKFVKEIIRKYQAFEKFGTSKSNGLEAHKYVMNHIFVRKGPAWLLKAAGAFPNKTFPGSCTQTNGYVSNERLLEGIVFFSISVASSFVLDIHSEKCAAGGSM